LQTGYPFKSKDFSTYGIKLLKGSNVLVQRISWQNVDFYPIEKIGNFKEYLLEVGDVVIAMDRPIVSEGFKISRISKEDVPCLLVQRIGRFLKTSRIDYEYLGYFLQSDFYVKNLSILQKGMDLPHISSSEILSPIIPLPSLDEQRKIASILSNIDIRIRNELKQKELFQELKKGLMQNLLTGKIRVKV
jgi:type I restriction enzyme S subunit